MKNVNTIGAGFAAFALGAVALAPGAVAAEDSGSVDVVNTETVQVYVTPDGEVASQRVYEQLSFTGEGTVTVDNPVEESGLRNLDGFSGVSAEDGVQSVEMDVDGYERARSVSDFEGELPLEFDITYLLDGEEVEPGDLVGASGALEVVYSVRNVTAQPQEITYDDGKGGTVTETVDVPIPIVGSMTTTVPSSFTDVTSEQANIAGDGKGATKLSFTMTLFPPLGANEMEFSYQAQVSDAVVPSTQVTALPVNPLEVPTFATAGESYQNGADTGIQLADGATTIDTNLLKLRDGAGDLLAGLIQLSDGADELNAGLAGEAVPGATLLADGAGELSAGLGQIDDGAGQLADGAGQLAGGASDASSGSQKLEDGLRQISDGLGQLSKTDGLPKALRGVKELKAGVDLIILKVGAVGTPDTLIDGLSQLEAGSTRLKGGLALLKGNGSEETPGLVGAKGGVDLVKAGLDSALAPANGPLPDGTNPEGGGLAELKLGLQAINANFCSTHPAPAQCSGLVTQLIAGVDQSRADLTEATNGLARVSGGLQGAIGALTPTPSDPNDPNLMDGALALEAGLGQAKGGAIDLRDEGLIPVRAGLAELQAGLTTAVSRRRPALEGADEAYSGSGDLSDGLGLIAGGSGELSAGAGKLADGTGDASDGSVKLADGAGDLAEGLGDAADGSERLLAEGLAAGRGRCPAARRRCRPAVRRGHVPADRCR